MHANVGHENAITLRFSNRDTRTRLSSERLPIPLSSAHDNHLWAEASWPNEKMFCTGIQLSCGDVLYVSLFLCVFSLHLTCLRIAHTYTEKYNEKCCSFAYLNGLRQAAKHQQKLKPEKTTENERRNVCLMMAMMNHRGHGNLSSMSIIILG